MSAPGEGYRQHQHPQYYIDPPVALVTEIHQPSYNNNNSHNNNNNYTQSLREEPDIDVHYGGQISSSLSPPAHPVATETYFGSSITASPVKYQNPSSPPGSTFFVQPATSSIPGTAAPESSVVYVQQKLYFGRKSARADCPFCKNAIYTKIRNRSNYVTILFALLLVVVGLWFLCWLPFVMSCCKAVDHTCPNCNARLGKTNPCD